MDLPQLIIKSSLNHFLQYWKKAILNPCAGPGHQTGTDWCENMGLATCFQCAT